MSGPPGVGVGSGSAAVTVTVQLALTLPAVTVMTAVPGATPVTVPSAPTEATASCIYTQKGNKKIRKPQAANQTALIFDRRAAARLLSINSIRRLCWS